MKIFFWQKNHNYCASPALTEPLTEATQLDLKQKIAQIKTQLRDSTTNLTVEQRKDLEKKFFALLTLHSDLADTKESSESTPSAKKLGQ